MPPLRLSPQDAARLLREEADLIVFDVRDAASYAREHLHGARHLDEAGLSSWIRRLSCERPLLIYCYHGNASQTYAQAFADFRFTRAYSADGGYPALCEALARQTVPSDLLLRFLAENGLDGNDLDAPLAHGLTPLMRAALDGRATLVEELLCLGADPQRRNDDGNNALWLACVSRDERIVRALIAAGCDLDNRNDAGASTLMYTASSDRPELLALLLAAGADPWLQNQDGLRAVELAASRSCLRLLRHTADAA